MLTTKTSEKISLSHTHTHAQLWFALSSTNCGRRDHDRIFYRASIPLNDMRLLNFSYFSNFKKTENVLAKILLLRKINVIKSLSRNPHIHTNWRHVKISPIIQTFEISSASWVQIKAQNSQKRLHTNSIHKSQYFRKRELMVKYTHQLRKSLSLHFSWKNNTWPYVRWLMYSCVCECLL